MATRSIARTAIEGGRVKSSRYEEHVSTVRERRQEKRKLHRCRFDLAYREEICIDGREALSDWIDKDFADKLNPVERWLRKQCGRRWDAVYSEIRQKFDFRTTAGRHIVAHIRWWVDFRGAPRRWPWASFYKFSVDAQGRLYENV